MCSTTFVSAGWIAPSRKPLSSVNHPTTRSASAPPLCGSLALPHGLHLVLVALDHLLRLLLMALLDLLLTGALIEARSCERFGLLAPRLPAPLASFYAQLQRAEARHFLQYLEFAAREPGIDPGARERRLHELACAEAELATSPDATFRFHSGAPK